jgi:hypothetical protein
MKKKPKGWAWWCTPVTPAVWEVEMGGCWFQASQGKKVK